MSNQYQKDGYIIFNKISQDNSLLIKFYDFINKNSNIDFYKNGDYIELFNDKIYNSFESIYSEGRRVNKKKYDTHKNKDYSIKNIFKKLFSSKFAAINIPIFYVKKLKRFFVLFTLRNKKLSNHPGEFSFPGGKLDILKDFSLKNTAIRETFEELGLNYNIKNLIFNREILSATGYFIKSFISFIEIEDLNFFYNLNINSNEIEKVLIIDLLTFYIFSLLYNAKWEFKNKLWNLKCFCLAKLEKQFFNFQILNKSDNNIEILFVNKKKGINEILQGLKRGTRGNFQTEVINYKVKLNEIIWGVSADFLYNLLNDLIK